MSNGIDLVNVCVHNVHERNESKLYFSNDQQSRRNAFDIRNSFVEQCGTRSCTSVHDWPPLFSQGHSSRLFNGTSRPIICHAKFLSQCNTIVIHTYIRKNVYTAHKRTHANCATDIQLENKIGRQEGGAEVGWIGRIKKRGWKRVSQRGRERERRGNKAEVWVYSWSKFVFCLTLNAIKTNEKRDIKKGYKKNILKMVIFIINHY